jgi:hypothetical protein
MSNTPAKCNLATVAAVCQRKEDKGGHVEGTKFRSKFCVLSKFRQSLQQHADWCYLSSRELCPKGLHDELRKSRRLLGKMWQACESQLYQSLH